MNDNTTMALGCVAGIATFSFVMFLGFLFWVGLASLVIWCGGLLGLTDWPVDFAHTIPVGALLWVLKVVISGGGRSE